MKYIITESQYVKLNQIKFEHLKEPMFKYWDMNGGKDLKTTMKLFSIPPAGSTLVQDWLLEWMGGEDELYSLLNKYIGRVMNGQAGSYDFKFYLEDVRIYTHGGVEIYFEAVVDGDGKVLVTLNDGEVLDNVYDASQDDRVGWEVEDEIRDTVRETIEMIIPIEFSINIDRVDITNPGEFNS